jgi:hypothetical protein
MKETLLRSAESLSEGIWMQEILLQENWIEGTLTLHGCCWMSSLLVVVRVLIWACLLVDPTVGLTWCLSRQAPERIS